MATGIDGLGERRTFGHQRASLLAMLTGEAKRLPVLMDPQFMKHVTDRTAGVMHTEMPLGARP